MLGVFVKRESTPQIKTRTCELVNSTDQNLFFSLVGESGLDKPRWVGALGIADGG
jgi:hypothetical protein